MIHLTLTGPHAGLPFCGASRLDAARGDECHHANGAALERPEYRAKVCGACLDVVALEAYDADDADTMPSWVLARRGRLLTSAKREG